MNRRKLLIGGAASAVPGIVKAQVPMTGAGLGAPGGGGPTVAFNPTQLITGNGGFWRADMGVTSGGGFITQWNDQSSFGNNLTVGASQTHPGFSTTDFQGAFPGVTPGNNSNQGLNNTTFSFSSTTFSIFTLFQPKSNDNGGFLRVIWIIANGAANDFTNPSIDGDSGGTNATYKLEWSSTTVVGATFSPTLNTAYLAGVVGDGTHGQTWINGATNGSSNSFTSTIGSNPNKLGLGCNPATANSSNATYAFFGITQKVMSSGDWTNLKNWCNANWGTGF